MPFTVEPCDARVATDINPHIAEALSRWAPIELCAIPTLAQSVGRASRVSLRGFASDAPLPYSGEDVSDKLGGWCVAFVKASYTAQPYEAGRCWMATVAPLIMSWSY